MQGRVNRLFHSLVFGFDIYVVYFPISIELTLEDIAAHDSDKSGVLVIQLLEVHAFNVVDDFILDLLVHCSHILVDSLSFVVLELVLVLVGCGGVRRHREVYSRVRQFFPSHG